MYFTPLPPPWQAPIFEMLGSTRFAHIWRQRSPNLAFVRLSFLVQGQYSARRKTRELRFAPFGLYFFLHFPGSAPLYPSLVRLLFRPFIVESSQYVVGSFAYYRGITFMRR